jgi:hypothetical protein
MVLLGDDAQVDARLGSVGDAANLDARQQHGLCQTYHRLKNHFGRTRWISSVTLVMWNLVSIHFETVFVSVQDRCLVCAKRSSEIVLDAPNGTSR